MRYTRAGKSTHQRVPQDATTWGELKDTPPKQKNASNNGNFKGQRGGGRDGRDKFKEKKNFGRNRDREEESANFVQLGERAKPNEQGGKKVLGFGKSKQVKVFGQFWVSVEEGKRLTTLSKKLKGEGLSKKEIVEALKNERRKAEKSARRARDKTCFNCRQFGHVLFDCPKVKTGVEVDPLSSGEGDNTNLISSEICFKCGSTEHSSRHCKKSADKFDFAKCFICSKTGHIARQCPDNTKGIYPSGGSCNECGGTNHLAKDCPTLFPLEQGGGHDDTAEAVTGRVVNPFTSLEYEDVGWEDKVQDSNSKKPFVEGKTETTNSESNMPRAKKRKVKF